MLVPFFSPFVGEDTEAFSDLLASYSIYFVLPIIFLSTHVLVSKITKASRVGVGINETTIIVSRKKVFFNIIGISGKTWKTLWVIKVREEFS